MTTAVKKDLQKDKIRNTLKDVLTVFCKNAVDFNMELSVEALIGITIDKDNVLLVNVNEIIHSDNVSNKEDSCIDQLCPEKDSEKSEGTIDLEDCEIITIKDEIDMDVQNHPLRVDSALSSSSRNQNHDSTTLDGDNMARSNNSFDSFSRVPQPERAPQLEYTAQDGNNHTTAQQSNTNINPTANYCNAGSLHDQQSGFTNSSTNSPYNSSETESHVGTETDRHCNLTRRDHTLGLRKTVMVCSICTKVFVNKSAFSRHKRIHTSPAFVCNCGASFYRRDNGKAHLLKEPGHFLVRSIKPTDPLLTPANRT